MARYNREFLVMYLKDVCALELAEQKLNEARSDLEYEIYALQERKQDLAIPTPYPTLESNEKGIMLIVGAILYVGIYFLLKLIELLFLKGLFTLGIAVLMFWLGISELQKAKKSNEFRLNEYHALCAKRKTLLENVEREYKETVPEINRELNVCKRELHSVRTTLKAVYAANIIPNRYRDIYTAIYLYDWFSTSKSTDLDHALSMYVLEEIKDRLDQIIENQSAILLNQRIMIANQEDAIKQQKRHHAALCEKLNRIETSANQQTAYMRMIESNTKATACFAAASYLRSL